MFGFLGSTTMYVFSTLLTANGNLKQLNLIALSGIAVNFICNFILVPRLQAAGAASASLATQLFTAAAYMFLAQHYFKFRIDKKLIAVIGIFAVLVVGFNLISMELTFNWLVNFCLMLTASMLAAFGLRLINLREIFRLVKEKSMI